MDSLCRVPVRSQLRHPIIPTLDGCQQQADGSSIRWIDNSWDGSSRWMGDPNCVGEISTHCRSPLFRHRADESKTHRRCHGWRMQRKEASNDKSFHPTVLLLLNRIHTSMCAQVRGCMLHGSVFTLPANSWQGGHQQLHMICDMQLSSTTNLLHNSAL
jgi:hypothetical protein